LQPPYAHRRYDFYKQRISDFNSPDPRKNTPTVIATTGKPETQCLFNGKQAPAIMSKSLNFNDEIDDEKKAARIIGVSAEETFRDLQNLEEKQKTLEEKRPSQLQRQYLVEESGTQRNAAAQLPLDSEHLVEWEEVNKNDNQVEQQLVFAITGVQEKDKAEVIEKIQKLGGKYVDDCSNSPQLFTHLITPAPSRSEKYLMAIACGKFAVHVDFIHESHLKGRFIDEAEFEFGNPNFRIPVAGEVDDKWFKAPYNWRQRIKFDHAERFKNGAFTGKSFIIASQAKSRKFLSIIKAGGGNHVELDFKETLKSSYIKRQGIDFCLHEGGALSKENVDVLKQCKVSINRLTFISDFLMHETIPE
jgi:Regulator of Ty1 transposition protein 107 BRCT domain